MIISRGKQLENTEMGDAEVEAGEAGKLKLMIVEPQGGGVQCGTIVISEGSVIELEHPWIWIAYFMI